MPGCFHPQRRSIRPVAVKVAANGHLQVILPGQAPQLRHLLRRLAPTADFNRTATSSDKGHHQPPQLHAGKLVLVGMCEHRCATAVFDPPHHLGKIWPTGFDIARLALAQVAVKGGIVIDHVALLDHPGGKMRTPELAAIGLLQRAFQRTFEAALGKTLRDQRATLSAGGVHYGHGMTHLRMLAVHSQPNHVDRHSLPATGQLNPRHQLQARRGQIMVTNFKIAIDGVVVGNGQHGDTGIHGPAQQLLRCQRAIGRAGMGVEVNQHNLYTLGSAATGITRTLPGQPNDYGTSRSPVESMKQLLEFIPIVLFFVIYKMDGQVITLGQWSHEVDGIFSATAALMIATVLQVLLVYALTREIEKRLIWLSLAVLGFGALTLALRDGLFIQWKPTIFNWGMALAFAASQFIGEKNLMERLLGSQLPLPKAVWTKLNLMWITNFLVVGGLNLVVAYGFSEEAWVNYKLYSAIGFTLLLTVLTALVVSPYLKEEDATERPLPQDD